MKSGASNLRRLNITSRAKGTECAFTGEYRDNHHSESAIYSMSDPIRLETKRRSRSQTNLGNALKREGAALLFFLVVSLVLMYPAVSDFRTTMLGVREDNVQYAFMTGWFAQAIVTFQSPFVDPKLNYPDGLVLATTDVPYLNMIVVSPLTLIGGAMFGYNMVVLASHFLSGYFVYCWLTRFVKNRGGAIIGGLAFMLAPYRIAQSLSHLNLVSTFALPLFFWALDNSLSSRSTRDIILLGSATALVGSMSQYYLAIVLVIGLVYAVFTIILQSRFSLIWNSWKFGLSVASGGFVAALPYIALGIPTFYGRNVEDTRIYSARLVDFVLPSSLHPIWGILTNGLYPSNWIEHTLYLGLTATGLTLIALALWREANGTHKLIWLVVILTALLLALGTDLHITSTPLQEEDPFWLPMYYLAHLPIFNFMRVWTRFTVVAVLFISMLAGVGASLLMQRFTHWRFAIASICALLILLDFAPGSFPTSTLEPRGIERWLAAQSGDFPVAFLPVQMGYNDEYELMYNSLFHGKRIPAYNHPDFRPQAYKDFEKLAADFPDPDAVQALRAKGFRYLIVDKKYYLFSEDQNWDTIKKILAENTSVQIVLDLTRFTAIGFK